jgi:hypothetical protein
MNEENIMKRSPGVKKGIALQGKVKGLRSLRILLAYSLIFSFWYLNLGLDQTMARENPWQGVY